MKHNLALRSEAPPQRLRIHAWPIPHLVPPVVFATLIVLSQTHAASLASVAFWFWLAAVVLDEALARTRLAPWPTDETRMGAILIRMVMPLFLVFVLGFADATASMTVPAQEFLAIAFFCGFTGAIFAIPAAHELSHGKSRCDRISAVIVMSMFSYPHFCIAHLHGHHRNVATREDPATARLGESLYGFFQRSIPGGIAGAWAFEARRLRRSGHPVRGVRNRLLRYAAVLVAIYGVFLGLFGFSGVAFLAIQSVVAVFTLESMNYVQHYGLQRRMSADGAYEPVGDTHSWDSHHPLTNLLLFNLGYHSDHHLHGAKTFRDLRAFGGAPRLPLGYFALLWIAVLPPLWRGVMDHRVRALRHTSLPVSA